MRLSANVPQIHIHESIGRGVAGRERRETRISTRVSVAIHRVVIAVGWIAVVAVRIGSSDCVRGIIVLRSSETRPPVSDENRHSHPPWRRWWVVMVVMMTRNLQGLVLALPLAFVPPVLEPDLDLGRGELKGAGQMLSLRGGQVTLLLEAPLQLKHLSLGKEDARFPSGPLLLGGRLLRVWILTLTRHDTAALCMEKPCSITHQS